MDAEEYKMKLSRDWKNVVDYAREEGFRQGFAKAFAEAKARSGAIGEEETKAKIAKSLRESGLAMNIIVEVTGLTEEQINGLS